MSLKNFVDKIEATSCTKGKTVAEVARLMKSKNIGTVVVTDKNKPVGIVSDRDLVVRCLANSKDCQGLEIQDIMTTPVHTIGQEASILDVVELMGKVKVRRICIVDSKGEAVGMVSMADVFELLAHEVGQLAQALGRRHEKLFRRTKSLRGAA